MSDVIIGLKSGRLPQVVLDEVGPFSLQAHNDHVEFLGQRGTYDVFGNRFDVESGLYHPHPWSSSVFIVRTLLREQPQLGRLLEIGCGTGAVGLSLLSHGLADEIVLTDVDETSVQIARDNAYKLGLGSRTTVRQGSVFKPVPGDLFDSILFNMPLMHNRHPGMKHLALDDSLGNVAKLFFQEVQCYLKPAGVGYFSFSNISNPQLLEQFSEQVDLSLVAAEWVVKSGFWLMVYRFKNPD